jgi:hypothetical protein
MLPQRAAESHFNDDEYLEPPQSIVSQALVVQSAIPQALVVQSTEVAIPQAHTPTPVKPKVITTTSITQTMPPPNITNLVGLSPPSDEQREIINASDINNVIVDAVAGSGKTTTILHLALARPERRSLLLTYNARLKQETREKCVSLQITNLEVHSYHSFCVKYINRECYTDAAIRRHLTDSAFEHIQGYDQVIIDEAQDMTPLYFKIANSICFNDPYLVILGDRYQAIYGFNGSDNRYITLADKKFKSARPFVYMKLQTSYRVTTQIADFVNMLVSSPIKFNGQVSSPIKSDDVRIKAIKTGPKVIYCISEFDEIARVTIACVKVYGPSNIFILAPSVRIRGKNPLGEFANILTKNKIPIYIPISDDNVLNESVFENKVVFSTFHQAKGLERDCVIVMTFDETYYKYFNREADNSICSNELYVACTRAKKQLIVHHGRNTYMNKIITNYAFKFVTMEKLLPVCKIMHQNNFTEYKVTKNPPMLKMPVTDLIRQLQDVYVEAAMSELNLVQHRIPGVPICISAVTMQKYNTGDISPVDLIEEVHDITGIAIPMYHEYKTTGSTTILSRITAPRALYTKYANMTTKLTEIYTATAAINAMKNTRQSKADELRAKKALDTNMAKVEKYKSKQIKLATSADFLKTAIEYNKKITKIKFKKEQIGNCDWVSIDQFEECSSRLSTVIGTPAAYEVGIEIDGFDLIIEGSIDVISSSPTDDSRRLIELKATQSLSREHHLQAVLYALGKRQQGEVYDIFLYNVLHDELIEIIVSNDAMLRCAKYINHAKYHLTRKSSDDDFVGGGDRIPDPRAECEKCPKCANTFTTINGLAEIDPMQIIHQKTQLAIKLMDAAITAKATALAACDEAEAAIAAMY